VVQGGLVMAELVVKETHATRHRPEPPHIVAHGHSVALAHSTIVEAPMYDQPPVIDPSVMFPQSHHVSVPMPPYQFRKRVHHDSLSTCDVGLCRPA
jgi:hypothetical protein